MKNQVPLILSMLALAVGTFPGLAIAEDSATPAVEAEVPSAESASDFDSLVGLWVRPDGGYQIAIRGVDANGGLDAAYANPFPLPFAQAQASREDQTLKLFFELRAGGYDGSTYTLTYESADDVLQGVYYQAVAQQKFDVYFERAK
ncbi:MAG: hypothetical protein WBG92_23090 [Thiohalocapsa sp.]